MSEAGPPSAAVPPLHPRRVLLLIVVILAAAGFAYFWYLTPTGQQLRHEHVIHHWMEAHRIVAPLALIGVYIVLSLFAMPVWWLQIMAGHMYGLLEGIVICQIAATISAPLATWLWEWTAGEFAERIERRVAKLRNLEHRLGHNGLLVVMATRLMHVVPFGLSNYAFGLLRISPRQVMLGTLLGNLPAVCWLVGAGTFTGLSLANFRQHWIFFLILLVLNIVLLGLLVARYRRPQWFVKMGIE